MPTENTSHRQESPTSHEPFHDANNTKEGKARDSTNHFHFNSDDSAHLPPRQRYTESVASDELEVQEKKAVAAVESQLPRPEWYSSDDDEKSAESSEDEEKSDLTAPAEGGMAVLVLYTVLCFLAFVFSLTASCPIPWMKGKGAMRGRKFGIWKATGGALPDIKVTDTHDCSNEVQYWQAASAFAVLSTFATFGALIAACLLCVGRGHFGASFALSFYGMVFALVSWTLVAALFHFHRCGKGSYASIANLDAGFALMLLTFIIMLASLGLLAVQFFTYYTRGVHAGKNQPMRLLVAVLLCVVMLFNCVGPAFNQWSKTFDQVKVHVTMWRVEVFDRTTELSTYLSRRDYKCSTITRRMKVVAAFNVMGNIWLFVAIPLAVGACHVARLRNGTMLFATLSCIFSMVAWLTLAATRHGHLCTSVVPPAASLWTAQGYNGIPSGYDNGQIVFDGYSMSEGFGLMVTGWVLNLAAVILNRLS